MDVSLLTDEDVIAQVKKYFALTLVPRLADSEYRDMLSRYRTLSRMGFNEGQIVATWKGQGIEPNAAAAFVNAMELLEKGQPIQDPNERPSVGEILAGYGAKVEGFPWGKIALYGAIGLALYGFSSGAAKKIF